MGYRLLADDDQHMLDVRGLKTYFYTEAGVVKAVDGVDFHVDRGEVLGLVGESGCGKSVTSFSIMRLVGIPGKIVEGQILFDGQDLVQLPESEITKIRGNRISMIFQQPTSCLNPVFKVGDQTGRGAGDPPGVGQASGPRHGRSSCSSWWGSRSRRSGSMPIHTSCRAAWRSA